VVARYIAIDNRFFPYLIIRFLLHYPSAVYFYLLFDICTKKCSKNRDVWAVMWVLFDLQCTYVDCT